MASLKDLRGRINSVKSTRKITQAMKMVAAAKLRRAQSQAEAARPYAERMEAILASLGASVAASPGAPRCWSARAATGSHLLVVVTGDRGLAGAFNTNVGRLARNRIRALEAEGKQVKLLTVGPQGRAFLKREFASRFVGEVNFAGKKRVDFADAEADRAQVAELLEEGGFDVCSLLYNRFRNVITQVPTEQRLIPTPLPEGAAAAEGGRRRSTSTSRRGPDPRHAPAAQPRHPGLPRDPGEHRGRAWRAHDRDGQCHAQRRRDDQQATLNYQPHAPGQHHQGADRDHLRVPRAEPS
jgi:F-type H+-transporting ATPase subunit gamma